MGGNSRTPVIDNIDASVLSFGAAFISGVALPPYVRIHCREQKFVVNEAILTEPRKGVVDR